MSVYITTKGIVSSIGNNVAENLQAFENLNHGISKSELVKDIRKESLVGEVKLTNEDLIKELDLDTNFEWSRTTLLALKAAKEAFKNQPKSSNIRTGIISATSVGGMDRTEDFYRDYYKTKSLDKSHYAVGHDCGHHTDIIAKELGIEGYRMTVSTACSSAANALMIGARLILTGKLDRVLVGGADALSNFTINGFGSLMIFDDEHSRPFDETRAGLNLGEAAAYVVLESEKCMKETGNTASTKLVGWANANDAYHQTASSPDGIGATLAMQKALKVAGLEPKDIDYINAHGTGTSNNDMSESIAFQKVFENNLPPFSSTKAFTGHTLAAAGAIEAVYSILAIEQGAFLPNINFKTPIEGPGLVPETEYSTGHNVQHVLSNSFGFGGNSSTVIFAKN